MIWGSPTAPSRDVVIEAASSQRQRHHSEISSCRSGINLDRSGFDVLDFATAAINDNTTPTISFRDAFTSGTKVEDLEIESVLAQEQQIACNEPQCTSNCSSAPQPHISAHRTGPATRR